MSGIATQSYARVALDTGVRSGDPHQLVLMLYDGALAAVNQARAHVHAAQVGKKGEAIGKAIRIIDEGLKISLDRQAGGELATRLLELYEYLVMRLLHANLRNDETALMEVAKLLGDLREAWFNIRSAATSAPAGAATTGAAAMPAAQAAANAAATATNAATATSTATAVAAPASAPASSLRANPFAQGAVGSDGSAAPRRFVVSA